MANCNIYYMIISLCRNLCVQNGNFFNHNSTHVTPIRPSRSATFPDSNDGIPRGRKWSMCHLFNLEMHSSYFREINIHQISTESGTNHTTHTHSLFTYAKTNGRMLKILAYFVNVCHDFCRTNAHTHEGITIKQLCIDWNGVGDGDDDNNI